MRLHRLLVGLALASITSVATALSPAQLASSQVCTEPYSPAFVQRGYPFNEPPPAVDAASVTVPTLNPGSTFLPPVRTDSFPDFDGDGTGDLYPFSTPGQPTVTRPAGFIRFARSGASLGVTLAGDLNGEPGQEIWVYDSGDAWVVPYETPTGTYDPADVGIRVRPGFARPIPDWTGDGVDDLLHINVTSDLFATTRLLSGAEIMTVGVAGDARSVAPVATIPGDALVLADFGGTRPAIVTVDPAPNAFGVGIIVRVFDGSTTTAYTKSPPASGVNLSRTDVSASGVRALSGPDGRFVTVSGTNRSGGTTYWWSFDDPCRPLSAGGPTPSTLNDVTASAPASAVSGAARLTG